MTERDPPHGVPTDRVLRSRKRRHAAQPAPVRPKADEPPPQVRAPNRTEWPGPLNEEDCAALEAGWGFVE
jgi:hypothetical protein